MEVSITTRNLRIAPRKLRLVADKARYMTVGKALAQLPLVPNKGAHFVVQTIKAAIEAAKDRDMTGDNLLVQQIFVDEGSTMKRMMMHSRGRQSTIMKMSSHLTVVLSDATPKAKPAYVRKGAPAVEQPVQVAEEN